MGAPPGGYFGPFGGTGRRVGSDGLLEIKCRICEKTICKEMYRGFSTAICAVCLGEIERGKRPEEIMNDVRAAEQKGAETVISDIGPSNFKAFGIGKRLKDVVEKVKKAATSRRRRPLFDVKDEIK